MSILTTPDFRRLFENPPLCSHVIDRLEKSRVETAVYVKWDNSRLEK